jgi:RimJ/RimL family protein N-acetyltransferase
VDCVVLIVGESNFRSQRAVEKIGGRRERMEPRPSPNGEQRMNVVFVITREDFQRSTLAASTA